MFVNKFQVSMVSMLLWMGSISVTAQTYLYVSTTGNDATGTGLQTAPFATIEKAALIAAARIVTNPNVPVSVVVKGGEYRNPSFSTTETLSESDYNPQTVGERIWKTNQVAGTTVRLNNINGAPTAWITIKPAAGESVRITGDGDVTFSVRSSSYIRVEGFEIKGIADRIPRNLAWKYWGTYRYIKNGNFVYGDRKADICRVHNISPSTDIPPNVLNTGVTYNGLPNIESLNVERPSLFAGKGLLVQLSHHIDLINNEVYNFPGGGLRVTQSDYVNVKQNRVHHNSNRASVGTHGLVIEGLTPITGNNERVQKITVSENVVYSNYNEVYSWVQSKVIVTTVIDEGKGICLLRTSVGESNYRGILRVENNIAYDNGKSGIHTNDVDYAEIVNNTVYNNGHTNIYDTAISGGTNGGISIQSSDNIKIVNNIIVVPNGLTPAMKALSEGSGCEGETVTNNLTWGGGTSDFAGGFTIGDPKFLDMANNNVKLQSNSPAINAGSTTIFAVKDILGNIRTIPADLGAYERVVSTGLQRTKGKKTDFKVYPNPFVDSVWLDGVGATDEILVADVTGKVMQHFKPTTTERFELNLASLPSNQIYFLKVGEVTTKIIKQ